MAGMYMNDDTGLDFERAAAAHFGLLHRGVLRGMVFNTDPYSSLTLTVELTADDIASIAALMKGASAIAGKEKLRTFLGEPNTPHIPQPQAGHRL